MEIEIIGTESLGVRGLCCYIKTKHRKILIDPGIALGYKRHGLLPHPFQVAIDEKIQKRLIKKWATATDIVISHFHGDHCPLAEANPYQLNIKKLKGINPGVRVFVKPFSFLSGREKKRAEDFSSKLKVDLIESDDLEDSIISFSNPVPHGDKNDTNITVIMTKIEEEGRKFVHASDIQLLNEESVQKILDWRPDIVLAGGPPLYLSNRLGPKQLDNALKNALKLAENIKIFIIDHHLMRNLEGVEWIKKIISMTGKNILCGADFMNQPRMLLEAKRQKLYREMPVPEKWHKKYTKGLETTKYYWDIGKKYYKN